MSKQLSIRQSSSIERVLVQGDLSGLTEDQRLEYASRVCKAIGISLLFKPFDYISLKGRLVLYPNRACTEQLRKKHKVSIRITKRERVDNLYVVTAQALMGKKEDEAIGAVNIGGLRGEELANALMKAETKAKRRVTLSICGLGMLDEVEVKDLAEREAKEAAYSAAEETAEKIESTTERPAFESQPSESPQKPDGEDLPPASPQEEYRLKAGKNKGKAISKVSVNKLKDWMTWYEEKVAKGGSIHVDIQDDAFQIRAYLDGLEVQK